MRASSLSMTYTSKIMVVRGSSLADFLLGDVYRWQATNQAVTYCA